MEKKPQRRMEKRVVVQIRLTPDLKRKLEAAAKRKGLTLSSWLRMVAVEAERAQRTGGK
jgi:antitoxin component of RelBE/YafQ-DinJ toxin-antitoxin module